MLAYLDKISSPKVKGAVRIPLTATNWLGIETKASGANMKKYPNLDKQYQTLISKMVNLITSRGHVVILDLQ